MVKRDYMVRCRRCHYPYVPEDISRVRTCVFCRKALDIRSRESKKEIIMSNIKRYFKSSKSFPMKELVMKWLALKFDVNDNTALSYLNDLINNKKIEIYDDGYNERIRVLD